MIEENNDVETVYVTESEVTHHTPYECSTLNWGSYIQEIERGDIQTERSLCKIWAVEYAGSNGVCRVLDAADPGEFE